MSRFSPSEESDYGPTYPYPSVLDKSNSAEFEEEFLTYPSDSPIVLLGDFNSSDFNPFGNDTFGGNSNISDGSDDGEFSYSWGLLILLIPIVFVTIVGNLLVCISVILVKKLRKPQNYLLVSLAVSDLFVAIFVLPFAIINEFYQQEWPLNIGLCDLWVSGDVLLCTSSILSLCAISVDRYRAITRPLEYSAETTPKRMLCMILGVWIGSACVSLPPVLLLGNEHFLPTGEPICTVSQNFWYQVYATLASFYIPLCVMIVVYVKILRVVADKKKQESWKYTRRKSSRNGSFPVIGQPLQPLIPPSNNTTSGGANNSNSTIINKNVTVNGKTYLIQSTKLTKRMKKDKLLDGLKEHKASTTLGIIMTAFIICWLPFFIIAIIRPFLEENIIPNWLSSLVLWLGYFNSGLNPIIYATLNRDFRRPFKEILCFRCSTLDSLMKKEFYNEQFGDDMENVKRKQSSMIPLNPSSSNGSRDYPVNL